MSQCSSYSYCSLDASSNILLGIVSPNSGIVPLEALLGIDEPLGGRAQWKALGSWRAIFLEDSSHRPVLETWAWTNYLEVSDVDGGCHHWICCNMKHPEQGYFNLHPWDLCNSKAKQHPPLWLLFRCIYVMCVAMYMHVCTNVHIWRRKVDVRNLLCKKEKQTYTHLLFHWLLRRRSSPLG